MDAEDLFHAPFSEGRTRHHMVDAERWDLSDQCLAGSFPHRVPHSLEGEGARSEPGCAEGLQVGMLVGTGAAELSA